ncbi:MAG: YkgJ family cysteine cluster protein [Thermodesulfobacteriota bacterium]
MQNDESEPSVYALGPDDAFPFTCGPENVCFNACCRSLSQALSPYDALRLSRRLGISTGEFLASRVLIVIGPETGLPVVTLAPGPGDDQPCPFVTAEGCGVYQDRPGSCRTYPLARAAGRDKTTGQVREKYYLVREAHCQGHGAGRRWTAREWVESQGLSVYNEMNDLFLPVLGAKKKTGNARLSQEKARLFLMSCYDPDAFYGVLARGKAPAGGKLPDRPPATDEDALRFGLAWAAEVLFTLP